MRSLFTTLSPIEDWSNCWVTTVLNPTLDDVPVSFTSRRLSWITRVVVVVVYPLVEDVVSVLCLVDVNISWPVQTSTQEFHIVGANPVWGSTFKVLAESDNIWP